MTGPTSARMVLRDPSVDVAVLETARGAEMAPHWDELRKRYDVRVLDDPGEQIPLDDIQYWFESSDVADDVISGLGSEGDRIEICWRDGGYHEAIQRSLVVDGTVWTMTPSTLQANALDGLSTLTQLRLR